MGTINRAKSLGGVYSTMGFSENPKVLSEVEYGAMVVFLQVTHVLRMVSETAQELGQCTELTFKNVEDQRFQDKLLTKLIHTVFLSLGIMTDVQVFQEI